MFLKNSRFKYCLSLLAVFAVMILFSAFVKAETKGEGLTISPPILETTLESGKSISRTIRLTNPTDKVVEVYPRAMNFKAKGEGGEPAFFDKTEEDEKFSLAKWISFSENKIALAPEQIVEFKYDINVPEKAEAGGHYGVIFFATEPPKTDEDSSKVSIGSMIGSLVLVKVPGQIVEKGFLEEFSTNKRLSLNNDINFTSRISNLGNVHFKPKGKITIKSISGQTVDSLDINEQSGNVLPDSTRKFENKWEKKGLLLGRFTANFTATYGEGEKELSGSASFWVFPWWIFVIFVMLVAFLIFFILKMLKGKKRAFDNKTVQKNEGDRIILR